MMTEFTPACRVLGLVALLSSAATTAQPVSALTAQPDNPDLQGIGNLHYPFDATAFTQFGSALSEAPVSVSVTVDAGGAVTACDVSSSSKEAAHTAGQRLCTAIRQGHLTVPAWYAAHMRGGHIGLSLGADRRVVPVKPVHFVDAPQGEPAGILVFGGKCMVGRPSMSPADSDAVCAAFEAAGQPSLTGTPPAQSAHVGLAIEPEAHPYLPYTYPQIADRGLPVEFGAAPISSAEILTASDGKITASIDSGDYPSRALRENLEGLVKVLIGFDRSGKAQSCRPLSSTNSSYLANATCAVLMARTLFSFSPTAPSFDGLRYRVVPMRWVIPRD